MRLPKRFCIHGHDKYAPHGTYIEFDRVGDKVYVFNRCAVCVRLKEKRGRNRCKKGLEDVSILQKCS